ncbi:TonB-dependent receptor [Flavobacteriaceae bacterium Ap0902]|nr:TonB-dependent receptor [Flavobacteriaceae bacterium Ap0902]
MMLKRIFLLGLFTSSSCVLWAQEDDDFSISDTIELSTVKAMAELPITGEVVSQRKISEKNMGQDMPVLLKNSTSVVTTSDAGSGIGYTSMRVRGIAQSQINVTFNGVPVNDSESHGVFWVDFPDVSSSTDEILIQRGVGTSSNGAAAFGGSVNLETTGRNQNPFAEISASAGSFNTQKYMLYAGTGDLADGKFNMDVRGSYVQSDGYIDRASSDLYSGALNAYYRPNETTEFQILNIFGHEKTYQAWNGVAQYEIDQYGRTFNPAGAIYNDDWTQVVGYYDNQVDNYDQNHLHAYWRQDWESGWKSTATLHWTRGIGYYEEYKQGADLTDYRLNSIDKGDLVRRQWLDNNFYGGILNLEKKYIGDFDVYLGGSINQYAGDHYGTVEDVIGSDLTLNGNYYDNESTKTEISGFAKALYHLNGQVELFGDLQIRYIDYSAEYRGANGANPAKDFTPFDFNWTFLNPKAGINFRIPSGKIYASYGLTHREPTRSDILANVDTVKPETLHDFELGFRTNSVINFGINGYYMYYLDQLVLTGMLNDVGNPVRANVGESYRSGIELDASKAFWNNRVNLFGNLTWSKNKNLDYVETSANGDLINHGDTAIPYTPEIITSFGFDVFPIENLKLNLTNKYVDKQYVTNTENPDFTLDSYFVSDLLASYNFSVDDTAVEITLLVNNLLDEKYANNGYYGDWDDSLHFYPQAGTNFLAGVKVKF